jgi:hypothetical protein
MGNYGKLGPSMVGNYSSFRGVSMMISENEKRNLDRFQGTYITCIPDTGKSVAIENFIREEIKKAVDRTCLPDPRSDLVKLALSQVSKNPKEEA